MRSGVECTALIILGVPPVEGTSFRSTIVSISISHVIIIMIMIIIIFFFL